MTRLTDEQINERVATMVGLTPSDDAEEVKPYRFTTGGTFILDTPPDPQPLWGSGSDVLLAEGEALIIAGDQGLGKTTLAQQLALGRCGIPEYASLLGYPIRPATAARCTWQWTGPDRPPGRSGGWSGRRGATS